MHPPTELETLRRLIHTILISIDTKRLDILLKLSTNTRRSTSSTGQSDAIRQSRNLS